MNLVVRKIVSVFQGLHAKLLGALLFGTFAVSTASAQDIDLSGAQTSVLALIGIAALVMGAIVTWRLVKRSSNSA